MEAIIGYIIRKKPLVKYMQSFFLFVDNFIVSSVYEKIYGKYRTQVIKKKLFDTLLDFKI